MSQPCSAASQLENNLLLFLDPMRRRDDGEWHIVRVDALWSWSLLASLRMADGKVFSFSRRSCLLYLALRAMNFLLSRHETLRVYYFHEGLFSCFCRADDLSAYQILLEDNVTSSQTPRGRLRSLLPVVLRAELRFVAVGKLRNLDGDAIEGADLMVYSNEAGKLLLLKGADVRRGKGEVVKTTANPDYLPAIEREFLALTRVCRLLGSEGHVPAAGQRCEVNGRVFFTEGYVRGRTLSNTILELAERRADAEVVGVLQQLDSWHRVLSSTYTGSRKPLPELYAPVLDTFESLYGDRPEIPRLGGSLRDCLRRLDRCHPGLPPVLSHNDLWPGNFIAGADGLVAIDWERATSGRSGIFDYFWMLISTGIVYINDREKLNHYGLAARKLLKFDEELSRQVASRLRTFLETHGFGSEDLDFFLVLFFVEWSIQGYQAVGRQTPVDRIAFEELLHRLREKGQGWAEVAANDAIAGARAYA